MEPPGPPVTATLPTNSGLKSTRARLVPLPRPKVDAVRPKPEPGYGGMSPASAGSPMTMPAKSPKIKAEDAKPDSDVKNFRLRSGFAVGVPGALPALNVMRFTGAPAGRSTDMATWKQPIKMYRIEPAGTGEEEEGEDGGPPRWQLQRRRDEHDDPEAAPPPSGPREQMDLTKVDERTAKRRARASKKKLRPWRGGRSALDDETLTNTAALNAEIERRAQQRKDAAIAQLPFVLKDASGEADNEYEGELEEGLDGDQYVLLRFSVGRGLFGHDFNVIPDLGHVVCRRTGSLFTPSRTFTTLLPSLPRNS